jgi:hypothetical protein
MSCEEACEYLLGMYNYMVSVKPEFEVNYETKENPYETCKPYLKVLLKYHPDRRLTWDDSLKMRGISSNKLSEIVRIDAGRVIDYVKYVKEHECFEKFIKLFVGTREPDAREPTLKSMRSTTSYAQAPSATAAAATASEDEFNATWVNEERHQQAPDATRVPERRRQSDDRVSSAYVAPLSNYGISRGKALTSWNPIMGTMIVDLDDIRVRYEEFEREFESFNEKRRKNTMQSMVAEMPPKKTGEKLPDEPADDDAHKAYIQKRNAVINGTPWYLLKKGGSKRRKINKTKRRKTNKKSKIIKKKSRRVKSKKR